MYTNDPLASLYGDQQNPYGYGAQTGGSVNIGTGTSGFDTLGVSDDPYGGYVPEQNQQETTTIREVIEKEVVVPSKLTKVNQGVSLDAFVSDFSNMEGYKQPIDIGKVIFIIKNNLALVGDRNKKMYLKTKRYIDLIDDEKLKKIESAIESIKSGLLKKQIVSLIPDSLNDTLTNLMVNYLGEYYVFDTTFRETAASLKSELSSDDTDDDTKEAINTFVSKATDVVSSIKSDGDFCYVVETTNVAFSDFEPLAEELRYVTDPIELESWSLLSKIFKRFKVDTLYFCIRGNLYKTDGATVNKVIL